MYILTFSKRQWPGIWKRLPHAWSVPDMRVLRATPWCLCLKCVVDLLILPGLHDGHIGSLKTWTVSVRGFQKKKNSTSLGSPLRSWNLMERKDFSKPPLPPPQHPKEEKKKIDKKSLLVLNMVAPWNAKEETTDLQPAIVRWFFVPFMGFKRRNPWNCETCKSSNDLGPGLSQCSK